MQPRLDEIWVYLSASPLLGLTVTLLAYQFAFSVYQRSGFHPLANPTLIAVALLVLLLSATGTPYRTYFDGAPFVHFLLGPATVALAVPLCEQRARIRRLWLPLAVGLTVGVLVGIVSAVGIAWLLGASPATLKSLAPKSVTTPVAMGIAERIGGLPSLTATSKTAPMSPLSPTALSVSPPFTSTSPATTGSTKSAPGRSIADSR